MPPVQNTFSIIPDAPSVLNGQHDGTSLRTSKPPMTSKQVKKAYKKANKGPKLSKAEQRRLELFEQDRIRREFEKEKNQARARAARDKKKEREERARAEKKKKGLPLVDVRPSQDTIARFVRAKPKNRNDENASPLPEDEEESRSLSPTPPRPDFKDSDQIRQSDNADKGTPKEIPQERKKNKKTENVSAPIRHSHRSDDETPAIGVEKGNGTEHLSKKRRLDVLEEEDEDDDPLFLVAKGAVSLSPKPDSKPDPKVDVISDHAEGTPKLSPEQEQGQESGLGPELAEMDVDNSFSTIGLSEDSLFDDLLRETEGKPSDLNAPLEKSICVSGQLQDQIPPTECPPPKPPDSYLLFSKKTEHVVSPIEPSPLQSKTARQNPIPRQARQVSAAPPPSFSPSSSAQKSQPTAPGPRSFHQSRAPMAPPPVPPKFKSSNQASAGSPRMPRFLKPPPPRPPRTPVTGPNCSRTSNPKQAIENEPPPSTQLFVLNHLDDFFPSPSQEVREIFDEPQRKRIGDKASELNPNIPKILAAPYNRSVVSTPGINLNNSRCIRQIADRPEHGPQKIAVQPSIQPISQNTPSTFEMPFFCTQDLLLSSQDVKDIEEDLLPPPKAQSPVPLPPVPVSPKKDYTKQRDTPRRSPKRLFTSTCRELRYKYAMERSRTAAWEGPRARQKAREELDQLQALEDERLEALLANPDGEMNTTKSNVTINKSRTTCIHNTPTPRPARVGRSMRSSPPSSPSVPEDTVLNVREQPNTGPRPGRGGDSGSGETRWRNTRPKGSYEAMLELLAKGPKQKPGARADMAANGNSRYGEVNKDKSGRLEQSDQTTEEFRAMMTTIPASQETDYDGGEEWDDDELLCGMV
ncbi:hypothetical protein F5Y10DRAFT_98390 [Nemania abortiva]|nr:hypothetical protein F5Y10DRAFT_98390 [Nemania abortiva]